MLTYRTCSAIFLALFTLFTSAGSGYADTRTCENVDFQKLSRSVVQLTFMYDKPREDGTTGHHASAWFLDSTHLVTIGHVTENTLDDSWQTVTVSFSDNAREAVDQHIEIPMRLAQSIQTATPEYIAIIELRAGILGFEPLPIRFSPLIKDEPVVGVGYPGGILRYAAGWYRVPKQSGDVVIDEPPPHFGYLQFEIADELGNDRYVFDHGASGSPLIDCNGNVVAIVSDFMTQVIDMGIAELLITTHWGEPNITGIASSLIVPK